MNNDKYIGKLLDDRYEILEVIGTGGMAVVYKARCRRLNRMVAIKILKDEFSQDEDFRRRFHAESQAVAMLSHPNIVAVYDVSSSEDSDYIVMELIEGITLKYYMEKKGVLNWKETLHFAMQIAKALEHAHSRGIVHRDIKPHNVMVLKNGSVKVADFGIAQIMSTASTMTQEALGSVHYISPEQAKGSRVDSRSDVYSLGIVMYEMISGRVPYDGETPVAVVMKHINGTPQLPSTLNPNTPKGLEQIIMKAMAQQPKDRYPTATALLYDMDEFRKDPLMVFQPDKAEEKNSSAENPANNQKQEQSIAQKKVQPPRKKTQSMRNEGNSKIATIAIASCAVVGLVAIVIVLLLLPSCQKEPTEVAVPNLIGKTEAELATITEIQVAIQKEYNDEVPAGQVIDQYPEAGTKVERGYKVSVVISLGKKTLSMEDLTGMTLKEAQLRLEKMDLNLKWEVEYVQDKELEPDRIIRTEPAASEAVAHGQTVKFYISQLPTAVVPDVIGDALEEAQEKLNEAGLRNWRVMRTKDDKPEGTVLNLSVEPGKTVKIDKEIIIYVSSGKTFLGDLVGLSYDEVEDYLKGLDVELTVDVKTEYSSLVDMNLVIRTEPEADTELTDGMTLTIWYSAGVGMAELPNLQGQTLEAAQTQLSELGFVTVRKKETSSILPAGTVIGYAYAKPGIQVDMSRPVELLVSKGDIGLEDLTGKSLEEAQEYLLDFDLNLELVSEPQKSNDVELGGVIRTDPEQGSSLTYGQTVTIYYSIGPVTAAVPDVEGKPLEEAVQILNDAGFNNLDVKEIDGDGEPGHVLALSFTVGEWIYTDEVIEVWVAKAEPEELVTLTNYQFAIPGHDDTVLVTIVCDGVEILRQNVAPSTNIVMTDLTGSGIREYEIYIDGIFCNTETVVFELDE